MKDKFLVIAIIAIALSFSGCSSIPSIQIPNLWGSPANTPLPSTESFNAILINDTIPGNMVPGRAYNISITMRNTGVLSWSETNPITLVPNDTTSNDAILFNNKTFTIMTGDIVKTGSEYTWNFTMVAPEWIGNYTVTYHLSSANNTSFGNTLTRHIIVGDMNATVVLVNNKIQYYPAFGNFKIKAGNVQNVSITIKNMGRYDWTTDKFYLAVVDYNPNNATIFNPTLSYYLAPEAIVHPGEQCTWKFKLQAPVATGTYTVEYRMKQGDQWFGKPISANITVT